MFTSFVTLFADLLNCYHVLLQLTACGTSYTSSLVCRCMMVNSAFCSCASWCTPSLLQLTQRRLSASAAKVSQPCRWTLIHHQQREIPSTEHMEITINLSLQLPHLGTSAQSSCGAVGISCQGCCFQVYQGRAASSVTPGACTGCSILLLTFNYLLPFL